MKTYILLLFMLLLTIPSLASAEGRKWVRTGPPGKSQMWIYVRETASESKRKCDSNISAKKHRPNGIPYSGGSRIQSRVGKGI